MPDPADRARAGEGVEPGVALRPAPVEVDDDVGCGRGRVVGDGVDREARDVAHPRRPEQHQPVVGERPTQQPQGGYGDEEVAEAEVAQDQGRRRRVAGGPEA